MSKVYPKWIYHKTEAPKIVNDEAEHAEAGEGWEETPAAFGEKSDEAQGKQKGDQGKDGEIKTQDLTKMKVADLKALLISKGIPSEEVEDLKKDELIAKVGAL